MGSEVKGIDVPFEWTQADRDAIHPGATVLSFDRGVFVLCTGAIRDDADAFGGAVIVCFAANRPALRYLVAIGSCNPKTIWPATEVTTRLAAVSQEAAEKVAAEKTKRAANEKATKDTDEPVCPGCGEKTTQAHYHWSLR